MADTNQVQEVKVPKILMDLIPQYLENRRNELVALNDAFAKKDFTAIQNIGHKLKGNAASYGFTFLTEVGRDLENAAKVQDLTTIGSMLNSYSEYLSHVKVVPA